jgi:hypothetical protein
VYHVKKGARHYVGYSDDIDARINDHQNGHGAAWLKGGSGDVKEVDRWPGALKKEEKMYVWKTIRECGAKSVRGSGFSQCNVSIGIVQKRDEFARSDACFFCEGDGHFAPACPKR